MLNTMSGKYYISGVEVTAQEFTTELSLIREKAEYVRLVVLGKLLIEAVPEEYREEVQRRAQEQIAASADPDEDDVTGEEFLEMLEGVL